MPCLEQQDWRLWWRWRERETRSTPPKASGGDGDGNGKRHSTPFNPKPIDQAHSTRKQWETKEERAIGGDGDRRRWRSTEARERKIDEKKKDWSDERKKEMCAWERERELRVRYREERDKIVKKLYAHATVPVHICMGTVATCIYTQVCMGWCGSFFCSYCLKWAPFSIFHNFTSTDVIALRHNVIESKSY